MKNNAIEVKQVSLVVRTGFWLKPVSLLKDVALTVPEGRVFGFLGANGAGKTTLIHLLVGLRRPSQGEILIFGKKTSDEESRNQLGYLPERPYFQEALTGEEFLRYLGRLSGLSKTRTESRIDHVLKRVGLGQSRKKLLRHFSKGMLQRIGIAQALLHDPKLLILDEPMSGLDPIGRREIRDLIGELATEGKTIFFSSHVIPDVEAVCDEIALIEKGKIITQGSMGSLVRNSHTPYEIAFITSRESRPLGERSEKAEPLPGMVGGYRMTVADLEQVTPTLQKLIENKNQILWVHAERPPLEEHFR